MKYAVELFEEKNGEPNSAPAQVCLMTFDAELPPDLFYGLLRCRPTHKTVEMGERRGVLRRRSQVEVNLPVGSLVSTTPTTCRATFTSKDQMKAFLDNAAVLFSP